MSQEIGIHLHAGSSYSRICESELIFICVGTPPLPDGNTDLSMVRAAAEQIGTNLKIGMDKEKSKRPPSVPYRVVVVKSTVPPGTTQDVVVPIIRKYSGLDDRLLGFAMNPEFLREGIAVQDFLHPDRIVIGSDSSVAGSLVERCYDGIQAPVVRTGIRAAEMIKYVSNAFLATKISFSNEIGNICKKIGVDVYEVMNAVGMDHRIGPHFLRAGAGFGGSCFPKDVLSLTKLAEKSGETSMLLRAVLEVNERQPIKMVSLLEDLTGPLKSKRITILGLAFKEGTDDIRESRAIPVIRLLIEKGAIVTAYDPVAIPPMKELFPDINYVMNIVDALEGSDGCLIMTEWPEFQSLDKEFDTMRERIVIEGRKILTCKQKEGICW